MHTLKLFSHNGVREARDAVGTLEAVVRYSGTNFLLGIRIPCLHSTVYVAEIVRLLRTLGIHVIPSFNIGSSQKYCSNPGRLSPLRRTSSWKEGCRYRSIVPEGSVHRRVASRMVWFLIAKDGEA